MASPLDRLVSLVSDDMDAVNQTIVDRMESEVPLIPQLASYLVSAGGKRLRPLLTLAVARHLGHEGGDHVKLAAAVEFIHTATLLHDDVVDESDLRRGQAPANEIFGNQASVLVGDFLFSRSFQLMVETGSLEVLGILSRASAIIAEGEVLQLSAAHDMATTEETYLRVIESKTAALFEAACQVGAVVAGASAERCRAAADYGRNLGIAFQLADDVLDYSARQETLGKAIGDDFREGKITLPVILAYAQGSAEDRSFWERVMQETDTARDEEAMRTDLFEAQRLLAKQDALGSTMRRAEGYVDAALEAVSALGDGPIAETLLATARYSVSREF